MVIKTVCHFVAIILKKKDLTEKEGKVLEVVLSGREVNDLPWGRKGLPGDQG